MAKVKTDRNTLNRTSIKTTDEVFDFPCVNDFCTPFYSGDEREIATAWKNKKGGYGVFCVCCGEDTHYTKEEFRNLKNKFKKEDLAKKKQLGKEGKIIPLHEEDEEDEYEEYYEEPRAACR